MNHDAQADMPPEYPSAGYPPTDSKGCGERHGKIEGEGYLKPLGFSEGIPVMLRVCARCMGVAT